MHAPLQPANVEVPSGVAVSVTTVPASKTTTQVALHAIPAGVEETVPPPVPTLVTLREY
jgi:hypothetical protein